ncbi:uncharacterized protein [Antedon mediterranea]|uniref:uncharacterized protein n=1 Tax=Antedon mediterranea TaxID=105859 RepID=UPI003AF6DEBE
MEKRIRKPTTKYLLLTEKTLKKTLKDNFKHLESKKDKIMDLFLDGADTNSLNIQLINWLNLYMSYCKSFDKYCLLLTNENKQQYKEESLVGNQWLADVKTAIKLYQSQEKKPGNIPVFPERPRVKEPEKITVDDKASPEKEVSQLPVEMIDSKNNDTKKMKSIEKVHVAPLSSKSIPALFAVPYKDKSNGNPKSMRLCKRVIYIKNGMSYSNYVPVTQAEADSKNMFGIERVVNVLDENHKFKRHMVIKNWVNHVKPAKGNISHIIPPKTHTNTPLVVLPEKFEEIPVSKQIPPQQSIQKDKLFVQSTDSQAKHPISLASQTVSNTSEIKITSVFSFASKNDLVQNSNNPTSCNVRSTDSSGSLFFRKSANDSLKQVVREEVVNAAPTNNIQSPAYLIGDTQKTTSPNKNIEHLLAAHYRKGNMILPTDHTYIAATHQPIVNFVVEQKPNSQKYTLGSKPAKLDEIVDKNSKLKSKKKKSKKYEHRKHKRSSPRKRKKRAYFPQMECSSDSEDSSQSSDAELTSRSASCKMLKGVEHAQIENRPVRKKKIPRMSLPIGTALTDTESSSETEEELKRNRIVIKEEPMDPSDGYLNSFLKEQQLAMNSLLNQSNTNTDFPLVMIKKEPVSDTEDSSSSSQIVRIKEEPVSEEEDQFTARTESPHEEDLSEVCTSREDRVKQLKERIKEKQTVLAAFRKRPRISLLVNNI